MKGDEHLERSKKRTNEHIAKLVKANVEKANGEKKSEARQRHGGGHGRR